MKRDAKELLDSLLPKCPENKLHEFFSQVVTQAEADAKADAEIDPLLYGGCKGQC